MSEAFDFGSQAWLERLQIEINNSAGYAEAAKNWEGDIYFIIEAKGSSLENDIYMYMDLWHGQCRQVAIPTSPSEYNPEFAFSGSIKTFKQIVLEGLDPMKAIMTRKLGLKGNMAKIMRNVKAANQLVQCCTHVPTSFPAE
ncbi:MAG: SCP2 sterol-binding domain-containing protein [Chloroflexota bacterium]